jgi:hypothetical protein
MAAGAEGEVEQVLDGIMVVRGRVFAGDGAAHGQDLGQSGLQDWRPEAPDAADEDVCAEGLTGRVQARALPRVARARRRRLIWSMPIILRALACSWPNVKVR